MSLPCSIHKLYGIVQSLVIAVDAAGVSTFISTSWRLLILSKAVVTVKELLAKKLFTMLQQGSQSVPAT